MTFNDQGINLRKFNRYVSYSHFKMESIAIDLVKLVKSIVRRGDYMISIDLNQEFYHLPSFKYLFYAKPLGKLVQRQCSRSNHTRKITVKTDAHLAQCQFNIQFSLTNQINVLRMMDDLAVYRTFFITLKVIIKKFSQVSKELLIYLFNMSNLFYQNKQNLIY